MMDLQKPETFDDETLDAAVDSRIARASGDPVLVEWFGRVDAEAARRAEIRLERGEYGHDHDAAWYASRQTEAQWFAELGHEAGHGCPLESGGDCDCLAQAERIGSRGIDR